jgi:hypothetical protein
VCAGLRRQSVTKSVILNFPQSKSGNSILLQEERVFNNVAVLIKMWRVRMRKQQKEFLVNYLQNNVYLMEGRAANPTQLQRYNEKWQEFAEKLNQFKGVKKNVNSGKR